LRPGEQTAVELSVPTAGLSGRVIKSVDVHTNAERISIVNFEVRAEVIADVGAEEKGAVCR
jgi:hypothetical protein